MFIVILFFKLPFTYIYLLFLQYISFDILIGYFIPLRAVDKGLATSLYFCFRRGTSEDYLNQSTNFGGGALQTDHLNYHPPIQYY